MRALTFLTMLVLVCAGCWMVASMISPDSIAMAVGMLFGVLAGIPTALLVMAAGRQRMPDPDDEPERQRSAPVVILAPQPSTRIGWPEHIAPEDEELYAFELSAYGDTPRRLALPVADEQKRFRRRVDAGMLTKLVDDDGSAPPPGFRKIARRDGRLEREEWA